MSFATSITVAKKQKNTEQMIYIKSVLDRLRGLDADLLRAGEPMIASRLASLTSDLQIAFENVELVDK